MKQKVILSNVKQKCGPLPLGSAVNLNKLDLELFIKILYGVWSSLQPDHETYGLKNRSKLFWGISTSEIQFTGSEMSKRGRFLYLPITDP